MTYKVTDILNLSYEVIGIIKLITFKYGLICWL